MTKQKPNVKPKHNSKNMIKQTIKKKRRLDSKPHSNHLKKNLPSKNKIIKGKRITTIRMAQNDKKKNTKRTIRRNKEVSSIHNSHRSQRLNLPVNTNNNIINRFTPSNFNLENSLNICHSLSPPENPNLQFMNLNSENDGLRNNINDRNFGLNFDIPLSIENNIINEISLSQSNDDELLDLSFLNNISCNHFNRIERSIFGFLPEATIKDISNLYYENCLICLNNFEKHELVTTLPCSHIFHCACLREWLSYNKVCPLCRASIGGRRI
jgi:hypothetical protein